MRSPTPDVIIRYRTDGAIPDETSPVYDPLRPVILTGTEPLHTVLTAVAFHPEFGISEPRSASFYPSIGAPKVIGAPAVIGDPISFRPGQQVALAITEGVTVRYTLDESRPNESSPLYTGPISLRPGEYLQTASYLGTLEPAYETYAISFANFADASAWVVAGPQAPKPFQFFQRVFLLAETPNGDVHILGDPAQFSDMQNLYRWNSDGSISAYGFSLQDPDYTDLAALPDGRLVFARRLLGGLTFLDPDAPDGAVTYGRSGTRDYRDGPLAEARFYSPTHVAAAKDGTVYVSDAGRLRQVTPDGVVKTMSGAGFRRVGDQSVPIEEVKFDRIEDIAVIPSGGLLLADGPRLLRLGADGMVTCVAGCDYPEEVNPSFVRRFSALTVDRWGNGYAMLGGSILRVSPLGDVVTFSVTSADGITPFSRHITGLLVRDDGSILAASDDTIFSIAPTDADGDGVQDVDEFEPLSPTNNDLVVDTDGDGFSNSDEVRAHSDPGSVSSSPRNPTVLQDGSFLIHWQTKPGHRYKLEASEDFSSWHSVDSFVGGPLRFTSRAVYPEVWRNRLYFRLIPQ
ncbi:MAG: chitobiase/beta-hexosaminidase C-terminal domain-containing protein [Verrucomicrobiales bacterium]